MFYPDTNKLNVTPTQDKLVLDNYNTTVDNYVHIMLRGHFRNNWRVEKTRSMPKRNIKMRNYFPFFSALS